MLWWIGWTRNWARKGRRVPDIRSRYRMIPRSVWLLIGAKLFTSMLNGAFFLIFNIYLRKLGYDDPKIGSYGSMLYLGILVVGLPLGLFLRGRRLKPIFITGAILIPISAMVMLEAIRLGAPPAVSKLLLLAWSGSFVLIDSFILPFIVRATPKESESEAIALNFSMFAVGSLLAGLATTLVTSRDSIRLLGRTIPADEYLVLMGIAALNLLLIFLILPVREDSPSLGEQVTVRRFMSTVGNYEWRRIGRAVLPTTIIAVGAGLTIPFINLFFNAVFGLDSNDWGMVGTATAVIIFFAANFVPILRRGFGYRIAITLSQSLAVLMLILLALTQLFADIHWVVYLAVAFYMLRTPLMTMARPMTSELVMNYVGDGNRDLTSALMSSIWSGAWFISAKVFQWMRTLDLPYYQIFLMTACFYIVGVALYYRLIRLHEREQAHAKLEIAE